MKSSTYDLLTNICIAVAVASALLFERAGTGKWLVGGLAIAAGIVSACAYLYNQRTATKPLQSEREDAGDRPYSADTSAKAASLSVAMIDSQDVKFQPELQYVHAIEQAFRYSLKPTVAHFGPEVVLLETGSGGVFQIGCQVSGAYQSKFAQEVVEIVHKLSSSEANASYEFVLTREGNLTIRPIGKLKTLKEESTSTSEERHDPLAVPTEKLGRIH